MRSFVEAELAWLGVEAIGTVSITSESLHGVSSSDHVIAKHIHVSLKWWPDIG